MLKDVKHKLERAQKENIGFRKASVDNNKKIEEQLQEIEKQQKELQDQNRQLIEEQKQQNELLKNILLSAGKMQELLKKNRTYAEKSAKAADEAVYGLVFNNAISGSSWLLNQTFYPGRWAIGNPYVYVLYRVLNEYKPKHILELGQSTQMITQYVAADEKVRHRVVEHDEIWIDFFKKEHTLSKNSEIVG